jgi:acyl carrier protein
MNAAAAPPHGEAVESTVIAIIEDLVQDWGLDLSESISGQTTLVEGLEFASVDIIQLCVALEQHYERKLGFQDLLMVDGSYVSDLSIAEVARFVDAKLNQPKGEPR